MLYHLGRRVLRVETLHQLVDCSDPDITSWTEQPEKSRDYYTYFRIFFIIHQGVSQKQTEICKFFSLFTLVCPVSDLSAILRFGFSHHVPFI